MKNLKIMIFTILIMFILAFNTLCFGDNIYKGSKSEIDASNISNGIIKIKYTSPTTKKLKVIIEKDSKKYTYDLTNTGEYDLFPLQMGDGKYKVSIYENIVDNKYSTSQSMTINVKLKDDNSPFLLPNKLVNFNANSNAIEKAKELTENKEKEIEKLDVIYDYVISNIKYDTEKAKNVKSDYLPDIDDTLASNKGICFDYAAIMAAMLRSQSIPTKLVTGYSTNTDVFHAWNEVYIKEAGWIVLNEMYFDGNEWKLMDSTIASSSKQSKNQAVIEHTNKLIDKKNYTKQYEY
jgi:transglutaminase/protease-like cytokinesis protein 3